VFVLLVESIVPLNKTQQQQKHKENLNKFDVFIITFSSMIFYVIQVSKSRPCVLYGTFVIL